jgi:hypothetical protein
MHHIQVFLSDTAEPAPFVQLQQEKDAENWGVDIDVIHDAINDCGITCIRTEVCPLHMPCSVDTSPCSVTHAARKRCMCR